MLGFLENYILDQDMGKLINSIKDNFSNEAKNYTIEQLGTLYLENQFYDEKNCFDRY